MAKITKITSRSDIIEQRLQESERRDSLDIEVYYHEESEQWYVHNEEHEITASHEEFHNALRNYADNWRKVRQARFTDGTDGREYFGVPIKPTPSSPDESEEDA